MERITGGEARRPLLFVILEKRRIQNDSEFEEGS
jgi:hypothetical protein